MTTDKHTIPPADVLLARDPFAFLAPEDPLALVIALHQRSGMSTCSCRAWDAPPGSSHAEHLAAAIRQHPAIHIKEDPRG